MTDSHPSPGDDAAPVGLLDFVPVVRKIRRPDGWTPELQRDYIRRLAISGSPQQVCTEMGKHVTGVEALYKVPGADSFRAAWDEAVRVGRSAQGLDCGPPHLGPVPGINRRPPRGAPPSDADPAPDDEDEVDEESQNAVLENIFRKFMRKVKVEREARLAGRVVAADFYLRQITYVEVLLDLMASGLFKTGWQMMGDLRRGGDHVVEIAETAMSRILDEARRAFWAEAGDLERPEHPPRRYLVRHAQSSRGDDEHGSHDGYSTEPTENLRGGDKDCREEQIAAREKQHREDAEAQIAHETAAREAWAARHKHGEDG